MAEERGSLDGVTVGEEGVEHTGSVNLSQLDVEEANKPTEAAEKTGSSRGFVTIGSKAIPAKIFWIVVIVSSLVVVGIIVGVAVALTGDDGGSAQPTTTAPPGTATTTLPDDSSTLTNAAVEEIIDYL